MIVRVDEIHTGRGGSGHLTRDQAITRYRRSWRVITATAFDDSAVILNSAYLPLVGSQHPVDSAAYLREYTCEQDPRSKVVWTVHADYSTEYEIAENPLDKPAEITWESSKYSEIAVWDKDNYGIVNTAGDFFDPPVEKDNVLWHASVLKNVSDVPDWFFDASYQLAINSDPFTLDGYVATPLIARLGRVSLSRWLVLNGIRYRTLTMEFEFRYGTISAPGWTRQLANVGFRQIASPGAQPTPCKNSDGTYVSAPVQLDGDGKQIANPTAITAWQNSITFHIHQEKSFAPIQPYLI
jgi:hypothetical protein